eukprot:792177-Heterocapsa_arctica.AAC.1
MERNALQFRPVVDSKISIYFCGCPFCFPGDDHYCWLSCLNGLHKGKNRKAVPPGSCPYEIWNDLILRAQNVKDNRQDPDL